MTESNNPRRHGIFISPVQQMVSSCSGAILTSVFVTPLDVVRIRLQAQKKPFAKGMCFMYCNGLMDHVCACLSDGKVVGSQWYKKGGHFTGMQGYRLMGLMEAWPPESEWYKKGRHFTEVKCSHPSCVYVSLNASQIADTLFRKEQQFTGVQDAFVKIVRNEGISSLWSGLPPTLVMAVPATVIYFSCYEQLKVSLNYQDGYKSDWWKPMAAGAIARVWAVSLISPLEMIRTKMQSEQLTYRELAQGIKWNINNRGVLSLWRGLAPTLMKDVPFSAFYWFSYENMKTRVLINRRSPDMTFMDSFTVGAISGTMTAVLTQPFDVIKTHRQIELGEIMTHARGKEVTSTWLLMKNLYHAHGIKALYTGLFPRIMKVAPACAIMISSYEYFKQFFRNLNDSKLAQSEPKQIGA